MTANDRWCYSEAERAPAGRRGLAEVGKTRSLAQWKQKTFQVTLQAQTAWRPIAKTSRGRPAAQVLQPAAGSASKVAVHSWQIQYGSNRIANITHTSNPIHITRAYEGTRPLCSHNGTPLSARGTKAKPSIIGSITLASN